MILNEEAAAKVKTALQANKDFLEILKRIHNSGALLIGASDAVVAKFEQAIEEAEEKNDSALALVLPNATLSAYIFGPGDGVTEPGSKRRDLN